MSAPQPPRKLTPRDAELIACYSEGLLTEAQAAELNARLHEAPQLLALIAQHAEIEEHLRSLLGEARAADRGDWFLALAELDKGSEHAELVDLEALIAEGLASGQPAKPQPMTVREAAGALGYLALEGLRSRAGVASAVAALLLLAGAIGLSLIGQTPTHQPTTQRSAPVEGEPAASRPVPVATLTADHEAQWAAFGPAPGDTLFAGQRLTLTRGFAEITTSRGAVALLEAPATIEFTDHDNALRLHAGKLVGICETDASKGFVVRTAALDITDLGTRFGVEAAADITEAHVFEGEVLAARPDAPRHEKPILLAAEQSARGSVDSETIEPLDHTTDAFANLLPESIALPSTGQGLAVGQPDRAWSIVAIDGRPLASPIHPAVYNHPSNLALPAGAQWVAWALGQPETYLFQTRVQLPADLDPADASIALQCVADDRLVAIVVNGHRVPVTDRISIAASSPQWLRGHLKPGENVIGFEIINGTASNGSAHNPVGLCLTWRVEPANTPASWNATP